MSLHNTQSISIAWRKGFNDTCVNFAAAFTRGIFKIYGFYDRFKERILHETWYHWLENLLFLQ